MRRMGRMRPMRQMGLIGPVRPIRPMIPIPNLAPNDDQGYTLLELLAYVAILAVFLNITAGLYLSTNRLMARSDLAIDRARGVAEIETAFRDAVASASAVADAVGPLHASESLLVLRRASTTEEWIVLGAVTGPDRFSVATYKLVNGAPELASLKTYSQPLLRSQFTVDSAIVTLTIGIESRGTTNTVSPENTFLAALHP